MARLSGSASRPSYLELPLGRFLEAVSVAEPAPAAGSVAAAAVAMAAALCVMAARLSTTQLDDAPDLATAAEGLRDRAAALCEADAAAYGLVIEAMRLPREPDPEDRSGRIAAALSVATDVPLEVVQIAVKVAALAERLASDGNPSLLGDAVTAALLADSGARAAAALVVLNLGDFSEDDRTAQVAVLLAEAAESARSAWQRIEP
jgi:formiminotetrahydrofolate cyclodeaminase